MPHKTSSKDHTTPPLILRRSPRFVQIVLTNSDDPKTPNPDPPRRTRSHFSPTPVSFTRKNNRRSNSKERSQKLDSCSNSRKITVYSKRLNRCEDECNEETLPRCSDRGNRKVVKRVTRSSCSRDLDNTSQGDSISKRVKGKSQKSKVKHSKKNSDHSAARIDTLAYDDDDKISEQVLSVVQVLDEELLKKDGDEVKNRVAINTAVVVPEGPVNVRDVNMMQKNIGVKRTRDQFENGMGITQGWTKDQEFALERAYFEAKPTPHFWKKVSKMVPGKSAQECFDKIHGSHLTPPQPRTRCRARVSNLQNPSFSASKLLNSTSPNKRPKYRKQKSHIIQRNVRHMLQNQYKVGQDCESDMFSLLEPTFNPSVNLNLMLTTPVRTQETDDVLKRSSTVRKSVSRYNSSYGSTLVSPPVLKQVKNKALHEKYIDLLNCREANRKAASAKSEKLDKSKVKKQESSAERKDAIKAAKNALVFGAKDAIDEFQHQQSAALNNLFDYESGDDVDEDNDQVF
ncbi:hypothetical protein QVD17_06476 [Tagetes erecta]|uniref:Myb-like domain-containing protein n=1 Tax=Tagetes erecta TaxID=13708 RepID=A0AAD8LFN9_TARER|nr:hypothetical protein QVD17_06476 [Tagetes erecta]